jgi:hypothetical protein
MKTTQTDSMKGHPRSRRRVWLLTALGVMLLAGHGVILYYASSHLALSAGLVSGVILLIVIKHLGLLGPTYAVLRSRWRRR